MSGALYNIEILRLATAIPHLGVLDCPQARVEKRSLICGSRVSVDVVLGEDGNVMDFAQSVNACALGQASAALLGAHVIGRSVDELREASAALAGYLSGTRDDYGDWPGLGIFAAGRAHSARHASIRLPFDAATEAVAKALAARAMVA